MSVEWQRWHWLPHDPQQVRALWIQRAIVSWQPGFLRPLRHFANTSGGDFLKRHVLGMRGADTVHHEQYISQRTQQAAAFSLTERRMFATVYKLSAPKRLREKVPKWRSGRVS